MPCPETPPMKKCDPKCRCNSGPCAGIAFPCGDPCPTNFSLDNSTCSCERDCVEGWGLSIHDITTVKIFNSQCIAGEGIAPSTPFYEPLDGTWDNVVATQKTSVCGGYYWDITGTCDDGPETLITSISKSATLFGVAEGTRTVTVVAPEE